MRGIFYRGVSPGGGLAGAMNFTSGSVVGLM
jgi:hypothetical protein